MKNLPVFFLLISLLLLCCTEKGKEWSETTDANGLRYQQVPIYPSLNGEGYIEITCQEANMGRGGNGTPKAWSRIVPRALSLFPSGTRLSFNDVLEVALEKDFLAIKEEPALDGLYGQDLNLKVRSESKKNRDLEIGHIPPKLEVTVDWTSAPKAPKQWIHEGSIIRWNVDAENEDMVYIVMTYLPVMSKKSVARQYPERCEMVRSVSDQAGSYTFRQDDFSCIPGDEAIVTVDVIRGKAMVITDERGIRNVVRVSSTVSGLERVDW